MADPFLSEDTMVDPGRPELVLELILEKVKLNLRNVPRFSFWKASKCYNQSIIQAN